MDFKYLSYFIEIVEQGNISKAAEKLRMAQPPLSQLLKKIEEEVGATLIERYRKKWELTESGKLFYDYAVQTLNEFDYVKLQIEEVQGGTHGQIHIGVGSSCMDLFLTTFAAFTIEFPHIQVVLTTGTSEQIKKQLENRAIDLAFILKPEQTKLFEIKVLAEQNSFAMIPKSWKWQKDSVTLADFHQQPFIMLSSMKEFQLAEQLQHQFLVKQIQPSTVLQCKDIPTVIQMVAKGLGASIIPETHLLENFAHLIEELLIEDFSYTSYPIFIRLKDKSLTKSAEKFWGFL